MKNYYIETLQAGFNAGRFIREMAVGGSSVIEHNSGLLRQSPGGLARNLWLRGFDAGVTDEEYT